MASAVQQRAQFEIATQKFGVQVEVSSPGKALLGGASANYGFETHFSYKHGWDSGESTTRTVTNTANEICFLLMIYCVKKGWPSLKDLCLHGKFGRAKSF